MLMASLLPASQFATFGIVYALQSGISMLAPTGLFEAAVGRLKAFATGDRRRALFMRTAGLFWATCSACLLIMSPFAISSLGGNGSLLTTLAGIALGVMSGYAVLQAGLLRIQQHNAQSLMLSAGVPLCATAGLVAGALLGLGLTGIFGIAAASGAAAFVAVRLAGAAYPGSLPRRYRLAREVPLLAPYFAINLLGWLTGYGMNFLVDGLFEPAQVAMYTFVIAVGSISQLIASSLNMVLAPRFYEAFNDERFTDAESASRRSFMLLAAVLGLIGFVTVAALPWITALLSDNLAEYGRDRLPLALLMGGYILGIPWWHGQNYYHVAGEGRALMRLSIVSGVASLALWVGAMLVFGTIGIYLGFALQLAMRSLWMMAAAQGQWQIRPPWAAIVAGVALTMSALLLPAAL